jgi:hypothetical protein
MRPVWPRLDQGWKAEEISYVGAARFTEVGSDNVDFARLSPDYMLFNGTFSSEQSTQDTNKCRCSLLS